MKKTLKILFIFIFCLLIFSFCKNVKANSIDKISMDIYVDTNGNATVTETWTCEVDSGTEIYHPYYNLGKSQIKNLTVSENGRTYQTLNSWDSSKTFSEKAYKCGINKITNGVELCWGVSSYDSHTYQVKYTITNFVAELKDAQMIYWTLIPYDFSNTIGNVYIKIHTDFNIPNSVDVWGYGNYGGTAYVYDGYIEMQSDGSLAKNEYMTILVKFPSNTFNTLNSLNHDFNYYYEMAEEGSTKYNKGSSQNSTLKLIGGVLVVSFVITYISFLRRIFGGSYKTMSLITNKDIGKVDFGELGRKTPPNLQYYRDIPCNGDIFRAYYIAYNYRLTKSQTDLIGAIILKWLKDSIIRVENKQTSGIFKTNNIVIYLKEVSTDTFFTNERERKLYNMMYEASKNGVLEDKEFKKWCRRHYTRILTWINSTLIEQRRILEEEGLLIVETRGKIFKNKVYVATPELKEETIQLAGLRKYLKEYTLIGERKAIEVTLFEEYLIYAQIMGIAKEVAKEFKEVYPEIVEQSNFNSYDNIIAINLYSTRAINAAMSAESRARSYSSGGGGFSSGGGGGGSFGGGGGRRRNPLI